VDNTLAEGWLTRVTVRRLRDGSSTSATETDDLGGYFAPATGDSDTWYELCGAMWGLGGWMWWWGTGASAQYDRVGVWNRVLTSEELEELYGVGLGWTPGG
jgi:hypothetical protein